MPASNNVKSLLPYILKLMATKRLYALIPTSKKVRKIIITILEERMRDIKKILPDDYKTEEWCDFTILGYAYRYPGTWITHFPEAFHDSKDGIIKILRKLIPVNLVKKKENKYSIILFEYENWEIHENSYSIACRRLPNGKLGVLLYYYKTHSFGFYISGMKTPENGTITIIKKAFMLFFDENKLVEYLD